MKQRLISSLVKCGFVEGATLILQGTLDQDAPYPDTFVTIWTEFTADNSHFDNTVNSVDWNFSVVVYSNDAEQLEKKAKEVVSTLRQDGFIPQGVGQDIPSDEPSHTGWAMEFTAKQYLKNN